MTTIVSYLRVSTVDQTVENQCQAINTAGWKPSKVFADEAVSGTTAADSRKHWKACLNYLPDGDTLVVYALDRIGRSTIDVLQQVNTLADKGVRLVTLQQGFDTASAAGKLALTMFAAFAEFEHSIRKERHSEGISRTQWKESTKVGSRN